MERLYKQTTQEVSQKDCGHVTRTSETEVRVTSHKNTFAPSQEKKKYKSVSTFLDNITCTKRDLKTTLLHAQQAFLYLPHIYTIYISVTFVQL